jgi:hypothetical protein
MVHLLKFANVRALKEISVAEDNINKKQLSVEGKKKKIEVTRKSMAVVKFFYVSLYALFRSI